MNIGYKCRVRLDTGEVVEAVYDSPLRDSHKAHKVYLNGNNLAIAWPHKPEKEKAYLPQTVRFVGNPCVLLHEGVSV